MSDPLANVIVAKWGSASIRTHRWATTGAAVTVQKVKIAAIIEFR
jgi:hypothetical protein